ARVITSVGERIRRDVDDAHHARARQVDCKTCGLPMHGKTWKRPTAHSRPSRICRLHATVGAGSVLTAGGLPGPLPPEGGVRGVQSLGGRGSLPAMMSSSCSMSMVSQSSSALAM